jgi:hypothetical protein
MKVEWIQFKDMKAALKLDPGYGLGDFCRRFEVDQNDPTKVVMLGKRAGFHPSVLEGCRAHVDKVQARRLANMQNAVAHKTAYRRIEDDVREIKEDVSRIRHVVTEILDHLTKGP